MSALYILLDLRLIIAVLKVSSLQQLVKVQPTWFPFQMVRVALAPTGTSVVVLVVQAQAGVSPVRSQGRSMQLLLILLQE